MNELILAPSRFDDASARVVGFARQHSSALILGCMLSAALAVWFYPAAPETRCLLVKQQALGIRGGLSLSIVLTALGWWAHKPAMRFIRSRRPDESGTPSE